MTNFINRFKLPTILGLGIILAGLISGLYLVVREQTFISQAAPSQAAANITVTNLTDNSATISWQTNISVPSFVTFGQNEQVLSVGHKEEQTMLDDRDTGSPRPHLNHYATLKGLLPQTHYQFKIVSGKTDSDIQSFDTAKPLTNKQTFSPVIGSVFNGSTPVNDGIVYLAIQGAITQSALVKTGGNFLLPLVELRGANLSDYTLSEDTIGHITITTDTGSASINFKLKASSLPLPPVKLGQNLDLTAAEQSPVPSPTVKDVEQYDLNNDGKINSADYSIVASCFGKKPSTVLPGNISCAKADLNKDGKIDQKDLNLMSQKLTEFGSP